MLRQVARTIAKHNMFRPGNRVAVAVSGGADSVALLHVLRELADELGITLALAHLNHNLRGRESDQDEEFVSSLASQFGLKLFASSANVAEEARNAGQNLEQVGRKLRYQWFTQLMEQGFADKIAVGHTRSDQAETVLYRLLRGAGSAGLSGIRPVLACGIVRPLLEISREQVLAYLEAGKYLWREDSSNQSDSFDRNRLRQKLMPLLTKEWNRDFPAGLARMAEWAQGEEDYWRETVRDLASRHLRRSQQALYFQADEVKGLPPAALRRLLRAAIEQARGDLLGVSYEHVEAVRRLVISDRGGGETHLPGLRVVRSFGRVRLSAAHHGGTASSLRYSMDLAAPGEFSIPGMSTAVVLRLYDRAGWERGYNEGGYRFLDWERLPKPLRLRNWRPGDRYHPQGRTRARKLKSLFQESRIAAWERSGWPVVTAPWATEHRRQKGEAIVWARGFGPSAEFAPDEKSQVILEIGESASSGSETGVAKSPKGASIN